MTPPTEIRTKRGRARFVDGTVRFEESTVGYLRALLRDYWHGGSRGQRAIVGAYLFAILYGLGVLAWELGHGRWRLPALVVGVVGVGWLIGRARGYRSVDSLDLDRIESVAATRGSKALTRPRLVLTFRTDGGTRKRRVLLPSLYAIDGDEAFERAVAAFDDRGFDVARDR
ncbi:hypothetical protein [Halolamina sp. C58]|uniref:hypothetical protein n=1 Tax=Halolamina sp. C58 TaxID=3421640 RepID=UPI003EB8F604